MTKDELAAIEARNRKASRQNRGCPWCLTLAAEVRRLWKEVDELREHQGKVIPGDY